jgi:hypothetical protein
MKAKSTTCTSALTFCMLIVDIISSFLLFPPQGSNYNPIDCAATLRDVHLKGTLHTRIKQFMKLHSMS